jgi:hypothetical protein
MNAKTILLGLVCGLPCYFSPELRADTFIENPGFEDGKANWIFWVAEESRDKACDFSVVSENPHSGKNCARLESTDYARFCIGTQPLPVKEGETYRLSGWVRARGEVMPKSPGGFAVRLSFAHEKTDLIKERLHVGIAGNISRGNLSASSAQLPTEWTHVEATFEIPQGADMLKISIFAYIKGAIFLDDFDLQKVDKPSM